MADLIGRRLGQYEIIEAIGQGGMATVYRARQESMDRDVAIKVISNQLTDTPEFITRFEHEARLIAKLQHAHILPVYDFGREESTIFLVMRMVDGGSLDRRLREGKLPLIATARLLTQIASALSYAHTEGVVHRDLKPNNILMDKSGDPYLTDFGIAKIIKSSIALTATGAVMGTPAYMAPEQWMGVNVDARTDIYALGVMLYEMLTGELPFTGDTPFVLMHKHLDQLPPSPNVLNASLPVGVSDVINRAMAKLPEDRFPSAKQMAEAFNDVVTGIATPSDNATPNLLLRQSVPADEHSPTFLGATASAAAATARPAATVAQDQGRRRILWLGAAVAIVAIVAVAAGVLLSNRRPAYTQLLKLTGQKGTIFSVAWSPDSSKVASASEDKTINIWNANTGAELTTLRGHTGVILAMAWSADGKKLATASEDTTIRIWNPERGEAVTTLDTPTGLNPSSLVWSPDGTQLASGYAGGGVYIWNVDSKTSKFASETSGVSAQPLAWSPDGTKLATALHDIGNTDYSTADNSIQIIDPKTNKVLLTYAAHTDNVWALAWSPDGSRLASGSSDGTIRTWDLTTGKAVPLLNIEAQKAQVSAVTWSPDGKKISSSSGFINIGGTDDLKARVWDAETGKLIATLEGHTKPIRMAVWSPDGTKLATAGLDNDIVIWSTDK